MVGGGGHGAKGDVLGLPEFLHNLLVVEGLACKETIGDNFLVAEGLACKETSGVRQLCQAVRSAPVNHSKQHLTRVGPTPGGGEGERAL